MLKFVGIMKMVLGETDFPSLSVGVRDEYKFHTFVTKNTHYKELTEHILAYGDPYFLYCSSLLFKIK